MWHLRRELNVLCVTLHCDVAAAAFSVIWENKQILLKNVVIKAFNE